MLSINRSSPALSMHCCLPIVLSLYTMYRFLYRKSLQIDAITMSIPNIKEKGLGMIIEDQTGIGKGRIAASTINYAVEQSVQPILITEKASLNDLVLLCLMNRLVISFFTSVKSFCSEYNCFHSGSQSCLNSFGRIFKHNTIIRRKTQKPRCL